MNEEFAQIYDENFTKIYNYIYYRLLNHPDTEDVVSEVFVKALDSFSRYEGRNGASVSTWLLAIARNAVNDHFRGTKKAELVPFEDWDGAMDDREAEERRCLRELLMTLDARSREALALRYWGGMSYAEIAQKMGLTEKHISVVLTRAVSKLRTLWEK